MFSMMNVCKSSGRGNRRVQILRDVSLSVVAGEIAGIVGSRREGRTTLMQLAAGQISPDAGQMRLDEVDLLGLSARRRRSLFESQILWIDSTPPPAELGRNTNDFVTLILACSENCGMREAHHLARSALERVGAADCAARSWRDLSTWERLLVKLAHVAATRRRLIVIDDLFDDLGPQRMQEVRRLLHSLADELECGMLLGVSDLQSAWITDRVWCIDRGALTLMSSRLPGDPNVIALTPRSKNSENMTGWRNELASAALNTLVLTQSSIRINEMPAISRFMGITIAMYFDDHQPPHFHARSGEFSAKMRTDTLELLVGDLPRRELRLVLAWAELHASELQENWRRARAGETLQAIEPLR